MAIRTTKTGSMLNHGNLMQRPGNRIEKKRGWLRPLALVLFLFTLAASSPAMSTAPAKKSPPPQDKSTSETLTSGKSGNTTETVSAQNTTSATLGVSASTSGSMANAGTPASLPDQRLAMLMAKRGEAPATSGTLSASHGTSAPLSGGQPNANAPMNFNLKGANVDQILQFISDTTGKPVVKRKDVNVEINITTSKPVTKQETLDLIYDALRMEGFAVIETDEKVQIIPAAEMRDQDLLTITDEISTTVLTQRARLIRRVFSLQQTEASNLRDYLAPLLSKYASITADERSNKLTLVDTVRNCERYGAVIKELDLVGNKQLELRTIPLKYADATEMANVLAKFSEAGTGGKVQGGQPSASQPQQQPPSMSGSPNEMRMRAMMGMQGGGGNSPNQGGPSPAPGAPAPPAAGCAILPDVRTNSILIATSKEKMIAMIDLVAKLDVEKPKEVSIHTVTLKYADVERVSEAIQQLFQKIKGQSFRDMVEVIPTERGNSLVVLASAANFKSIQELVTELDTQDARKRETRTYPMKFVDASETAEELQQLYGNLEQNSRRSYYYDYYSGNNNDSDKDKVSFVPVVRSNSIMVIAPPTEFPVIEPLIKQLDQQVEKDQVLPKIYYIKYANAKDVEKVLGKVFGTGEDSNRDDNNYWYWRNDDNKDKSVGRLLGKISFSCDENTNSIIATTNNKSNYEVVDEMISRLDKSMPEMANTMIYPLENAQATSLSATLNILFGKPVQQQGGQNGPSYYDYWGGQNNKKDERPISNLIGQVRFADDPRTNSLIVTTASPNFAVLRGLIKDLDQPEPQVLVKVRVVEAGSDKSRKVGLRWTPDPTLYRQEDMDNAIQVLGGLDMIDTFGSKEGKGVTQISNGVLTGRDTQQTLDSSRGIIASSVNIDLLLQLLVKNTGAHMTNAPLAYISNNRSGRIFGGQNIPRLSNSQTTPEGTVNRSFLNEDIGVDLTITPHINKNGIVVMSTDLVTAQVTGESRFGSDVLDKRIYNTEVAVESKQTVVLGGIQLTKKQDIVRRMPLLGYIPFLGVIFQNRDTVDTVNNLYVFITPTVIKSKEDAQHEVDKAEEQLKEMK